MPLILFLFISLFCQTPVHGEVAKGMTVQLNLAEVVLNDEHREGIDWASIVNDYKQVPLKKEDNPIWSDKRYKLAVGKISPDDYGVLVEALDTVGKLRQWPQPAENILENVPTILEAPGQAVKINIVLKKGNEGRYLLNIEPYVNLSYEDLKRNTLTKMWFKAQHEIECEGDTTIVIGSMYEREEMITKMKWPILGDLPLLGLVFRHQGKLMQKTEKIIFIQVHFSPENENTIPT